MQWGCDDGMVGNKNQGMTEPTLWHPAPLPHPRPRQSSQQRNKCQSKNHQSQIKPRLRAEIQYELDLVGCHCEPSDTVHLQGISDNT